MAKTNKNAPSEPVNPPAPPAVTDPANLDAPPVAGAPMVSDPPVDPPADAPPVDDPTPDLEPPIEQQPAREGFVFLFAPEEVTGCSVNGVEYQADEHGIVEVPSEHVAELVDRGFESAGY